MASEGEITNCGGKAAPPPRALGAEDRPITEDAGTGKDTASASLVMRIEEVCDRFETAWKAAKSASEGPRLEEHLGKLPEPEQPPVLPELVALDIDYRRRAGEQPRPEEYGPRFPYLNLADLQSTPQSQAAADPSSQQAGVLHFSPDGAQMTAAPPGL